jgi:hypothetical protein
LVAKAPKPRSSTRSPRASAPEIWSKIVVTDQLNIHLARVWVAGGEFRDQFRSGHEAA